MYLNLFDSHTHTDNSPDAVSSPMMLCEAAVEYGFSGIAVTDHCNMELFDRDNYELRIRQSFFETLKARSVFRGMLTVSCGVELGQPLEAPERAEALIEKYDFDFVLCSLHALPGQLNFCYNKYANFSKKQLDIIFAAYLRQLIRTIKWGRFDSLAHLTYPLRCLINRDGEAPDLSLCRELVDEALRLLIQNGKALEINTVGLRTALGSTLPPLDTLKRYRELGGELITLGSDAHCQKDVGAGVSEAMDCARAAGFRYFAFYRERKPQMYPLA